jgi:hypothetical protein
MTASAQDLRELKACDAIIRMNLARPAETYPLEAFFRRLS